jgi:hypothetical protein
MRKNFATHVDALAQLHKQISYSQRQKPDNVFSQIETQHGKNYDNYD